MPFIPHLFEVSFDNWTYYVICAGRAEAVDEAREAFMGDDNAQDIEDVETVTIKRVAYGDRDILLTEQARRWVINHHRDCQDDQTLPEG